MRKARTADDRNARRIAFTLTAGLHIVAVAVLAGHAPARRSSADAAPIVVSLVTAPTPAATPPATPPVLPKPLPVRPAPTRVVTPAPPPAPVLAPIAPFPLARVPSPGSTALATLHEVSPPPIPGPAVPATAAPLPPVTQPSFTAAAAYLDNPPPPYPAMARRAGEQGKVVLRVLVSASGAANEVELRTSSGSPRLDQAALETVWRWRFVPARQGNEAVAAWVLVPIVFSLES